MFDLTPLSHAVRQATVEKEQQLVAWKQEIEANAQAAFRAK
jgi:hypothetical protein